ncbi:MAG TPA: NAD(+) synthase [Stellaceae bacterium]|jgi:NAD+ synthase (glutamine-hydrolysing)|nr:NAD(+) synthase [Stellaceae bacterium]
MPDFFSPYRHQFVRLAACVPQVAIAEPAKNAAQVLEQIKTGDKAGIGLMVFPELGLSAYAIDDLLFQSALLAAVEREIGHLIKASRNLMPVFVVGAPLHWQGRLYNCAAVIHRGRLIGIVPKIFLPNYREFYERRHFTSGEAVRGASIELAGQQAPFGIDLVFTASGPAGFTFHVEICEDLWVPQPPSAAGAAAGAEILLNLSASNITIGKAEMRRLLCASQAARCIAAYAYSASGSGESTTDLAWDGQAGIFECGDALAETKRFSAHPEMAVADIDLGRIRQERMRTNSFGDDVRLILASHPPFRRVEFPFAAPGGRLDLRRPIERFPFVPSDPAMLRENCYEAYNIQVQGLAQRLSATGLKKLVIGVSGGLDSTQALMVSTRVMDRLGLPRGNVLAYTLPGFATSNETKANAWRLMNALGVSAAEIDIRPAANQMFGDIGHGASRGEKNYDITFENVQAGLRTDYLFRLANHNGALVVGTGDLSELGLGWCTYGVGDHMSHYNPNASVSKTLIQHLIRFVAASGDVKAETAAVLHDILATEISPELVPAGEDGVIQSTESFVGPYALQDFNLFYVTRFGFAPSKIAFLAWSAWHDAAKGRWPANIPAAARCAYTLAEVKSWLRVFLKRFFEQSQFKRSALPNGPKISSGGSLSPRGDWRAPSDSHAAIWLDELEQGVPDTE